MARVEETVTINRPIEDVFAYLISIERQPEWIPTLIESTTTSSGPIAPGTTFRQIGEARGRRLESDCEIIDMQAPHLYEMRSSSPVMTMQMRFNLTAQGTGTRITSTVEGKAAGAIKMPDMLLSRSLKKQFSEALNALKGNLESGKATGT